MVRARVMLRMAYSSTGCSPSAMTLRPWADALDGSCGFDGLSTCYSVSSDRNGLVWVGIGMVYTAKTWYGLRRSQYHGITGILGHTGKAKNGPRLRSSGQQAAGFPTKLASASEEILNLH